MAKAKSKQPARALISPEEPLGTGAGLNGWDDAQVEAQLKAAHEAYEALSRRLNEERTQKTATMVENLRVLLSEKQRREQVKLKLAAELRTKQVESFLGLPMAEFGIALDFFWPDHSQDCNDEVGNDSIDYAAPGWPALCTRCFLFSQRASIPRARITYARFEDGILLTDDGSAKG